MAVVVIDGDIRVPEWVVDLVSFRRWCHSEEFPTSGRIDYIQGEVWVDTGSERNHRHHAAWTEFTVVLGGFIKAARLGRYFAGSLRLTHPGVDLSVVPAGFFASNERLRHGAGKIRESRNGQGGFYGIPNMVLHFVGDDTDRKAEKQLRASYRRAGVDEYWLVEVRGAELEFSIYRLTAKGYVAQRTRHGWLKSRVFGKSFRLTRAEDPFGNPEYTLEVR